MITKIERSAILYTNKNMMWFCFGDYQNSWALATALKNAYHAFDKRASSRNVPTNCALYYHK